MDIPPYYCFIIFLIFLTNQPDFQRLPAIGNKIFLIFVQSNHYLYFNKFSKHCIPFTERRYSKDHEWVSVENNIGTVGVSEHAQVGTILVLSFGEFCVVRSVVRAILKRYVETH